MVDKEHTFASGIELRLRTLRGFFNLEQAQIAEYLNLSEVTYKSFENINNPRRINNKYLNILFGIYVSKNPNLKYDWLFYGAGNITDNDNDLTHYLSIAYRATYIIESLKIDLDIISSDLFIDIQILKELMINTRGKTKQLENIDINAISWKNAYLQDSFITIFNLNHNWFLYGIGKPYNTIKLDLSGANDQDVHRNIAMIPNRYQLLILSTIHNDRPELNINWLITGKGTETVNAYEYHDKLKNEWNPRVNYAIKHNLTIPVLVKGTIRSINARVWCQPLISNDDTFKIDTFKKTYQLMRQRILLFLEFSCSSLLEIATILGLVSSNQIESIKKRVDDKRLKAYEKLVELENSKLAIDDKNLIISIDAEIEKLYNELPHKNQFNRIKSIRTKIDIWKNTRSPLHMNVLKELSYKKNMNLHWLLTGEYDAWLDFRSMCNIPAIILDKKTASFEEFLK